MWPKLHPPKATNWGLKLWMKKECEKAGTATPVGLHLLATEETEAWTSDAWGHEAPVSRGPMLAIWDALPMTRDGGAFAGLVIGLCGLQAVLFAIPGSFLGIKYLKINYFSDQEFYILQLQTLIHTLTEATWFIVFQS